MDKDNLKLHESVIACMQFNLALNFAAYDFKHAMKVPYCRVVSFEELLFYRVLSPHGSRDSVFGE